MQGKPKRPRRPLGDELVRRGLAASKAEALSEVAASRIAVSGSISTNPARLVAADEPLRVIAEPHKYVSRAGAKLEAGLDAFGVAARGRRCLDVGASTGGFTDCLLARGAAEVVALDAGRGQLDWRLRTDGRVTVIEGTSARGLVALGLGCFDLVVVDVSLTSICSLAEQLAACLAGPLSDLVVLVKPQYEMRGTPARPWWRSAPGEVAEVVGVAGGGEGSWRGAMAKVARCLAEHGAPALDVIRSPLPGREGSTEFLMHARRRSGGHPAGDGAISSSIEAAVEAPSERPIEAPRGGGRSASERGSRRRAVASSCEDGAMSYGNPER